jgi:hypothetical protein
MPGWVGGQGLLHKTLGPGEYCSFLRMGRELPDLSREGEDMRGEEELLSEVLRLGKGD